MKFYQRFICLTLCVLCAACVFLRPVSASATMAEIATSYGDVAQVAPYLIPIIAIIIGLDWYYSNLDEIEQWALDIYNNASTAVRQWADQTYADYIDGTSVFKIPSSVKTEINNKAQKENKNKLPDTLPYVIFPSSFLTIDKLSQEDLLSQDAISAIQDVSTGVTKSNSLLSSIRSGLTSVYNGILSVGSTLNNVFEILKSYLHNIYQNVTNYFQRVLDDMFVFRAVVENAFIKLTDLFFTYREIAIGYFQNIVNYLHELNIHGVGNLQAIKESLHSFKNDCIGYLDGFKHWILSIRDSLLGLPGISVQIDRIANIISEHFNPDPVEPDDDEKPLDPFTQGGLDLFGSFALYSGEFLEGLRDALMCAALIFNLFAGVSGISNLVYISVTIGSICALLGIAVTISNSYSGDGRSNKSKAGG